MDSPQSWTVRVEFGESGPLPNFDTLTIFPTDSREIAIIAVGWLSDRCLSFPLNVSVAFGRQVHGSRGWFGHGISQKVSIFTAPGSKLNRAGEKYEGD
jgi:hypothetical protein